MTHPPRTRLPAEDLPLGEPLDLGSHSVSAEEIIRFASEWDDQYFHTDPEAARDSHFGELIASGLHTLSLFQRLSVAAIFGRYDVIAGKEIRRLRFLRPVRADDTLTGTLIVQSVTPDNRGRALVSTAGTLRNQDGIVLEVHMDSFLATAQSGD